MILATGLVAGPSPAAVGVTGVDGHQGGLDLRVQTAETTPEGRGRLLWRFRTGGPVRSTADLSADAVFFGSSDGHIYALSREDGRLLWDRDLGAAPGSPTVVGDRIFLWDRAHRLHALATEDGRSLWTHQANPDRPLAWGREGWDYLLPAPAVTEDAVFGASGDGNLYVLDPRDGRELWHVDTGARMRTTPTVSGRTVFVGNSAGILFALDTRTGEERWRFESEGSRISAAEAGFDRTQLFGAVAVDEERVYLGSRDARLYALDRETGEERWRVEEESAWVMSVPTVVDGVVYSARSSSRNLRAIDAATGEERWVTTMGGSVWTSPLRIGERLYLTVGASQYNGGSGGSLVALDPGTGEILWTFDTDAAIWNTPLYADGRFYFGADDGTFHAITIQNSAEAPERSVFWDAARVSESYRFADARAGERLRDGLLARGYRLLDLDGLRDLLDSEQARGHRLVFAMDDLPAELLKGLRDFLDRGGHVIWSGIPPGTVIRDPETGQVQALDAEVPSTLLDVDFSAWHADVYPAFPTEAGHRQGLSGSWLSSTSVIDDDSLLVLARDSLGRPVAWSKSYGDGGRFVYASPRPDSLPVCAMSLVVEFGLTNAGRSDTTTTCDIPR